MSEAANNYDGRIGNKMIMAVKAVAQSPYESKCELAKKVGPHASTQYGYQTVNRCINRGFIKIDPDHDAADPIGKGAVVITDVGRDFVDQL